METDVGINHQIHELPENVRVNYGGVETIVVGRRCRAAQTLTNRTKNQEFMPGNQGLSFGNDF
jgi:hypothetical protein